MILTKQQVNILKQKLYNISEDTYKIKESKQQIESYLGEEELEIFNSFLKKRDFNWNKESRNNNSTENNSAELINIVKEFKSYISDFNKINITTAFIPSKETINKVITLLENEIKENSVLTFNYNIDIIAGTVVEYKGIHKDFSLAKKIKSSKHKVSSIKES